jgi:DNA repair and recombination protein RAD52
MAGAFSSHLVDSFNTTNKHRPPFNQTPDETKIFIHGPMSFNPKMHGFNNSMDNSSASIMFDMSDETAMKVATLQTKLDKKLGPEYISQRPGPGGAGKLTYAEGWKIINLANEVFGFNGWSTNIVSLTTDFSDYSEETRRYSVGVSAIIRGACGLIRS